MKEKIIGNSKKLRIALILVLILLLQILIPAIKVQAKTYNYSSDPEKITLKKDVVLVNGDILRPTSSNNNSYRKLRVNGGASVNSHTVDGYYVITEVSTQR